MFGQQKYVTTREFHRTLDKSRANESRVQGLQAFTNSNSRQHAVQQSEQRVDCQRRVKRYQQQNEELLTGYAIEQQQRQSAQKTMLRDQDEKMAAAMYDLKQQQEAEEQNVRRICEESEELKTLKEKLTQAKISKVRAAQLQERAMIDRQIESQEAQKDMMMEEDRRKAAEKEYEESQRKLYLNIQSKRVLQNQIAAREVRKAEGYEAFLREKAMVDEIVKGIEAEDRAKMAEGRRLQVALQADIKDFLKERKVWRKAEKERTEEELRKIEEYNEIKRRQHAEIVSRKRKIADGQDEILRKLTKEIEDKRREEEDMRSMLNELHQEEAEQKALEKMANEAAKRDNMKREMMVANDYQRRLKAEKAAEQALEEQKFRDEMMRKFENDRRLERMNEQRRQREMRLYKQEVERLIQERRDQYQQAVEAEFEEMRVNEEQERFRLAVVERERQRLLREHAVDLGGYLPKGVLKDNRDYQTIYGKTPNRGKVDFSPKSAQFNPVTNRPASNRRDNGSRSGRRVGEASPKSRDALDNFFEGEANTRGPPQGSRQGSRQASRQGSPSQGSRQGSQQGNRPGSRQGSQQGSRPGSSYRYNPDKGPSDRPF